MWKVLYKEGESVQNTASVLGRVPGGLGLLTGARKGARLDGQPGTALVFESMSEGKERELGSLQASVNSNEQR